MIRVEVERVEHPGGTLAYGYGYDEEGAYVKFAGDARPMGALAEGVDLYGTVTAGVEAHQVIMSGSRDEVTA